MRPVFYTYGHLYTQVHATLTLLYYMYMYIHLVTITTLPSHVLS